MDQLTQWLSGFLETGLGASSSGPTVWEMGLALVIAYFGGFLSSLTPCIYPMIPITISVVGGTTPQHLKTSKKSFWPEFKSTFTRSLAYVSGMSVIYAFLGVLAAISGRVFGTLTQTFAWSLGLGIFMNLAALVMMDVIPFDPQAWIDRIKRKLKGGSGPVHHHTLKEERKTSLVEAFVLGISSGFIAAPCTTPVFAALLGYVAQTQSVGFGLFLMLSFAWGLGTLLLIIALFTGTLQLLPRSGNWMKHIKLASGLLLLAYAQYLIYRAGVIGGP